MNILGDTFTLEVTDSRTTSKTSLNVQDIVNVIRTRTIYFNDLTSEHWFFDFKLDNLWISSLNISNDFKNVNIEIYN